MKEQGFHEFQCIPISLEEEGLEHVLLAIKGPSTGNVYNLTVDPESQEFVFLGRIVNEDGKMTLDQSAIEDEGIQSFADGNRSEGLFQIINVNGQQYCRLFETPYVFTYEDPLRFVGLLRKDMTLDTDVDISDTVQDHVYPPELTPEMRPGTGGFVIGPLNGSWDAADAYNQKVWDSRPHQALRNDTLLGVDWEGYDPWTGKHRRGANSSVSESGRSKGSGRSGKAKQERKQSVSEQIADKMWKYYHRDRTKKRKYVPLGPEVITVDQTVHPLFRPGACRCPHCSDMRNGVTGVICHCEHCYIKGYWETKSDEVDPFEIEEVF
mmetsp:Transcript_22737/g.35608  ORF Transcript_22737/g.35608 Transcript_22737/m.35608 type:complete len:323 (+) Transcript_22737:2-970(+)